MRKVVTKTPKGAGKGSGAWVFVPEGANVSSVISQMRGPFLTKKMLGFWRMLDDFLLEYEDYEETGRRFSPVAKKQSGNQRIFLYFCIFLHIFSGGLAFSTAGKSGMINVFQHLCLNDLQEPPRTTSTQHFYP